MLNPVEILRVVYVGRGMCAGTHMLGLAFIILLVSRIAGIVIDAEIRAIVLRVEVVPREDITVTMGVGGTRVEDPVRLGVAVEAVTINLLLHSRSGRPILRERRTSAIRGLGSSLRSILAWSPISGEMFRPWAMRR